MADKVAVANLRAVAEIRLRKATVEAARLSGVEFSPPQVPDYEPDLKAARLIESTADFIERLNNKRAQETKR